MTGQTTADPTVAVRPAVRSYQGGTVSIVNSTLQSVPLDNNSFGPQVDPMHFTSAANLTGTVSKTASQATLIGSGTTFTTQLSVGQLIDVPGTTTERRIVTAIASDTSLTVNVVFANTATAQTATRVNNGIVIYTPGWYALEASVNFAANATGYRGIFLRQGNTESNWAYMCGYRLPAISGAIQEISTAAITQLPQWQWIELFVEQTSGGSLNSAGGSGIIAPHVSAYLLDR